jgi:hypothetical protein
MEENLVHDTTALTLARARRLSAERLTPAIELGTVEVEITSRTLPGEPEPFADAVAGSFAPFELGAPWGPAWSTTWFRLRGSVPEEWRGRRVEIVVDLGFDADAGPGFQAEGLAFAADGRYLKGIEPRNQYITVVTDAEGGEAVDIYVEAAANPDIIAGAFRPTDLGDRLTAPDKPLYVLKRAALTTRDQEVQALVVDLDIVTGLIEQLAPTDPHRGPLTRLRRDPAERCARHGGRRSCCARPRSERAGGAERPPRLCDRPCPHRLSVAVADPRNGSQGLPHFLECARAHGGLPRAAVRRLLRPAIRLAARSPPGTVRARARTRRRGALHSDRRHVGRVRHEHARR